MRNRLRTRLPLFIQKMIEDAPFGVLAYLVEVIDSLYAEDNNQAHHFHVSIRDLESRVRKLEANVSKTVSASHRGKSNE